MLSKKCSNTIDEDKKLFLRLKSLFSILFKALWCFWIRVIYQNWSLIWFNRSKRVGLFCFVWTFFLLNSLFKKFIFGITTKLEVLHMRWTSCSFSYLLILSRNQSFSAYEEIFRKTIIFYPLIRTHLCGYQVARYVSFSKNFVYILNARPPIHWKMNVLFKKKNRPTTRKTKVVGLASSQSGDINLIQDGHFLGCSRLGLP